MIYLAYCLVAIMVAWVYWFAYCVIRFDAPGAQVRPSQGITNGVRCSACDAPIFVDHLAPGLLKQREEASQKNVPEEVTESGVMCRRCSEEYEALIEAKKARQSTRPKTWSRFGLKSSLPN